MAVVVVAAVLVRVVVPRAVGVFVGVRVFAVLVLVVVVVIFVAVRMRVLDPVGVAMFVSVFPFGHASDPLLPASLAVDACP